MATKQWLDGSGSFSFLYNGKGDGAVFITSAENDGIDREGIIEVVTGDIVKTATIKQEGLREEIELADGHIFECSNDRIGFLKR